MIFTARIGAKQIAIRQEEVGILPWIHVNNSLESDSDCLSEQIEALNLVWSFDYSVKFKTRTRFQ